MVKIFDGKVNRWVCAPGSYCFNLHCPFIITSIKKAMSNQFIKPGLSSSEDINEQPFS